MDTPDINARAKLIDWNLVLARLDLKERTGNLTIRERALLVEMDNYAEHLGIPDQDSAVNPPG